MKGYDSAFVNVVAEALRLGGFTPGAAMIRAAAIVADVTTVHVSIVTASDSYLAARTAVLHAAL